jgi:hypothetical protein
LASANRQTTSGGMHPDHDEKVNRFGETTFGDFDVLWIVFCREHIWIDGTSIGASRQWRGFDLRRRGDTTRKRIKERARDALSMRDYKRPRKQLFRKVEVGL